MTNENPARSGMPFSGNRLKRVMTKAGVHRQSELVRLVTLGFGFVQDARQTFERT
jgi:hypothetical protein